MNAIGVLLANDHALLRAGFGAILRDIDGVEVVGEAVDGLEALTLVESKSPEIVLIDVGAQKLNGLELYGTE